MGGLRRSLLAFPPPADRQSLLHVIIEQAVALLKANNGGIYAYYPERGELTVIADYRRPGHIGMTLEVGEGMAGEVVLSGRSYSIVPDYSKYLGRAEVYGEHPLYFTAEDEWILHIFAEAVTVAIESAALVERLNEQKDPLARLVASAPDGMIVLDRRGFVILFNRRAEEILGYTADEVIGTTHVSQLYCDPLEPHRIAKLLYESPGGKPANYEVDAKNKAGEPVRLRCSATWYYDVRGECVGSVGYFEDLSPFREAERRLELLLNASTIVAEAESLDSGLQSLAEMLASLLPHTFCRVLLLDDERETLRPRAACYVSRSSKVQGMTAGLMREVRLADWPDGLMDCIEGEGPELLWAGNDKLQHVLHRLSRFLQLESDIQSLLIVPLRIREGDKTRVVGMLEFGELQSVDQRPFTQDGKDIVCEGSERLGWGGGQ